MHRSVERGGHMGLQDDDVALGLFLPKWLRTSCGGRTLYIREGD